MNRERSIEPVPNPLTLEATRSQPPLQQHGTASTFDQSLHPSPLESEAASRQTTSQPHDQLPDNQLPDAPISDNSIDDSIQRSPVQFESAIAPLQRATDLEQRLQPDLAEPTRSLSEPSSEPPSESPRSPNPEAEADSLQVTAPQVSQERSFLAPPSNQPQIQANQESTVEPEVVEAVASLPQLPTPETVNAPGEELAREPPSSDRPVRLPALSEPQSIAPLAIQPQIEPTNQSPSTQQKILPVLDHSTALEPLPLSSESATIQRQAEMIKAETAASSEELPAAIVPSSSDQPGKNSAQQAQETIQTRQAPEAKSTALPSDITASFNQPASIANETVLTEANSTANVAKRPEQEQIQPAIQEPMLQAKAELAEQSASAIDPSQQQQSARSNLSISPAVEQSSIDTIQANHAEFISPRQPLGLAKPLAEPPDLLMPKLDSQQNKADRQSGFEAIEPASPSIAPNTWSSIDGLLAESNGENSEAWQQQFNLQSPVTEELVSPIAERSPSTPAVDSQSPQANSEQQYTLISPIATPTPPQEAIDEQQLELFAQLVYGLIRDRLAIEKERYFHITANHLPWIDIISPEFFKSIKLTAQPNSPNAQQQPTAMVYPPQRQLEELTQAVYQLIQQKLTQERERSR
ncbi:MAG: hypothetical protein HC895_09170 [Leptolyngbyaceae cyanobacterium SM1_3_5]|nr:hypothetical protein [Leptolyngbyaceae cyanobacterium SM1_3_5]